MTLNLHPDTDAIKGEGLGLTGAECVIGVKVSGGPRDNFPMVAHVLCVA